MKITVKKTLSLKFRRATDWEPEREIAGFREDGTDLVILDKNNMEQARFGAGDLESWIVKGHSNIEP